jgi:hypothetical protein
MTTKKLLTGAALLGLGVTGAATFRPFERGARAQYGEPAQGKSDEGGSNKKGTGVDQGAKQTEGASGTNTAEPELGTRGEAGRAGPIPAADAGVRATEPEKGKQEPGKGAEPESSRPESNKFQQNKKGGDRDPIPPGNETASPTTRQSRPW